MQGTEPGGSITVESIDFSVLDQLWSEYGHAWKWHNPFITPAWLKAWWNVYGGNSKLLLTLVARDGKPIGIAPLMVDDCTARIIGSADLCDTGDVIIAAHEEKAFFAALLGFLESLQISRLVLEPVRPDSTTHAVARAAFRSAAWSSTTTPLNRSLEMVLPDSWQGYLAGLGSKQRHEVRRKLRRLNERGDIVLREVGTAEETEEAMTQFIDLFQKSRKDKASFMNETRELFFRRLADELFTAGMLRLQEVSINGVTAAMVFCIEHANMLYLYNNGYNPKFKELSIGLMSKVLSIKAAIEANLATYDFLGGTERYKYQLGGREVVLYSCVFECLS